MASPVPDKALAALIEAVLADFAATETACHDAGEAHEEEA